MLRCQTLATIYHWKVAKLPEVGEYLSMKSRQVAKLKQLFIRKAAKMSNFGYYLKEKYPSCQTMDTIY